MSSVVKKRLLRSVLFCPGNREKVLQKTLSLNADGFMYDLEDAVGPTDKESARRIVKSFVSTNISGISSSLVVRVNCPRSTEWGEADLKEMSSLEAIDAIVLPKVETQESIDYAHEIIKSNRPSSFRELPIWTMIETPRGVLSSHQIAKHPLVHCLVFGSNDLTKELRAKHTPDRQPLLFAMSQCIMAARAEGKRVLDGVHVNLDRQSGLEESCAQGRNLGFDGKTLIHPNQIDAANKAYAPSREEIELARKIVMAWEDASSKGISGVLSVEEK